MVHLNVVSFHYNIYILTSDLSLFSLRQRIIREAEEKEFIFPLVKKRGAII